MTVSVVVPVFNAELTLRRLTAEIREALVARTTAFEILLVNDGSADGSWAVITELAAGQPEIHGLDLVRNSGQHNALLAGIRAARYEVIVTIDDDLQNPPREIPRLLDALSGPVDVVYGVPNVMTHEGWRNLASKVTKWSLAYFMGADTARHVSAFRAFRARVRDAFADHRGPLVSIDVLLTWGTSRFGAVTVDHEPRRLGRSHYTVWKLLTHAMNMLTGFSTAPLQVASLVGFLFFVFGVFVFLFVIGRYFIGGGSPPGFAFLASIITLFAGAQLFALGIIGEYLARIHFRTMDRPSYTIRASADRDATARGPHD
jgi:glycosyltransferase involved in cell wall biosynthesis